MAEKLAVRGGDGGDDRLKGSSGMSSLKETKRSSSNDGILFNFPYLGKAFRCLIRSSSKVFSGREGERHAFTAKVKACLLTTFLTWC